MNDVKVKLKKFGIINVNKTVSAHKVGNIWHVNIVDEWHSVPGCDVEEISG